MADQQVNFFVTTKAISCLAFDSSGRFLAVGEKGHAPVISIFDTSKSDSLEVFPTHLSTSSYLN